MKKANITIIASPEKNKLGTVKNICVSSDKSIEYGYIKPFETKDKPTVLDAIITVHEEMYRDFKANPKKYFDVAETEFISKIFGIETFFAGFRVNNELPWDENDNGLTANKVVLKDNDVLNLFIVRDEKYNDLFLNFEESDNEFYKNEYFKIRLLGERHLYSGTGKTGQKNFTVSLIKDREIINNYITDDNGHVNIKIENCGEYILTVTEGPDYFIAPYKKIIIKEKPQI